MNRIALALLASLPPLQDGGGNEIAFFAKGMLFLLDSSGKTKTLAQSAHPVGEGPAWSPDGRWIAFHAGQGSPASLHLLDPRDGTQRKISEGLAPHPGGSCFSWSPGGSRIAFLERDAEKDELHLRSLDLYSGEKKVITSFDPRDSGWKGFFLAWSPMRETLALVALDEAGGTLFLLGMEDGAWDLLCETGRGPGRPAWSPDGRKLAFSSEGRIQVLDLRSRKAELWTRGLHPLWTKEGASLVFLRTGEGKGGSLLEMAGPGRNPASW